jgi:hypothetical protein
LSGGALNLPNLETSDAPFPTCELAQLAMLLPNLRICAAPLAVLMYWVMPPIANLNHQDNPARLSRFKSTRLP